MLSILLRKVKVLHQVKNFQGYLNWIFNEIKINDKNSVILQENKEKKEIDNNKKLNKSKFFFDKTFKQKKEIRLNILREDFSNVKKEQLKLKIKENISFLLNIDKIARNLIKIDYEKNLEAKLFDIVQKDSIFFWRWWNWKQSPIYIFIWRT